MATRSEEIIFNSPEDAVATDNDIKSCWCPRRYNPCLLWSSFCSWFLRLLERFFGWYGEGIAKHPLITIQICIVFVSVCSVGFVWFQAENRTEKLFIPQSSQAIDDLNTAEKYFRVKFREEVILLVAASDHPNVLDPECLRQAFKAHDAVMELESYSDFCVTLSGNKSKSLEDCVTINPLEFVQFNESKLSGKDLKQVQQELSKAYNDTTVLMRNGRPFWYNFNRMFGDANRRHGSITDAKALQMVYLISDPSDEVASQNVLNWEKTFIDKIASLVDKLSCFEVHYSSERSLDDAIAESSGSDVTLVSITFSLMITFACFMLGKFLNPLTGHSLLANAGVFAVALGIVAGFGLAMWCRVPFVSLVGVLPFLVLGIGIDDMFILVDELDRQPRDLSTTDRIKAVMKRSGATVAMTTATDLVAFAVSTSTSFPAIRYFCIYAALTVTCSFLMVVTYFVAIMSYDVRRIKSGRRDCLPFCLAPPPEEGAPAWDEPIPQTSNRVMAYWAKFLTHPITKVVVICFSLLLLGAGIYGVTQVDETFDRNILAKDDSYLKRFLSAQEKHFELSIEVSIVESGKVDYEMDSTQEHIRELTDIVTDNKHYTNQSLSWMNSFSQYAKMYKRNITSPRFLPELKAFLHIPDFSYFSQDLKFSKDGTQLEASRVLGFMKSSSSSTFQKNAMLTLREDITEKSTLDAFPIARPFIFFEQYAITSRETTRNLIIAALAVLVVTSPFLVDCTVTILVVLNFAALICELFGLMFIWDVSLNSVSMINIVMAIGFAVDYSAHIAHAYVMSNKSTANERVVDALSTLGASVLMGGFSTFLGMIVLAFAASEIFRIFFRMFLGIVMFGLLHGLCIMPVYLSLLCWRPAVIRPPSVRDSAERLGSRVLRDDGLETCSGLQLAPVGSEKQDCPGAMEETNNSNNDEQANQKDKGGNHVFEIGIQNKGIKTDDEELEMNSTGGDNKQKNMIDEEPDLSKDRVENNEELACTSEKLDTHTNDETPAPDDTPAVNKPEESIPAANKNKETIPAANRNEESIPAANRNKETFVLTQL
ncbi:Patched domain-containing protein 3 [Desmophyllum pertusum]|uniref:Patched domain-containing protein 3 n=1 Tax=Desmophyllum pertusum TaxID=174260 RepID=A0A9W9ZTI5_9CNID|nr:Patched domain-containing protein 3 [Desmophyllum pertusum]